MRKNIYIIIGPGRSGKSSLVRALTGIYQYTAQNAPADIEFTNGDVRTFQVWPQSAQEGNHSPEAMLAFINTWQGDNILMTLRMFGNWSAQEYLDLIAIQHNITTIVVLTHENNLNNVYGAAVNTILEPRNRPINGQASRIREWWSIV